jgi:segregation and condensation protein B
VTATTPAADGRLRKATIEAFLHARRRPASDSELFETFPGWPVRALLGEIDDDLRGRGIMLARAAGGWCLRTRPEASDLAGRFAPDPVKLSRAAMEVVAIVAAFESKDPVTRGDIERIRGIQLSPGVFTSLFEAGFIRPGRRRETPGRPLTWATTERFLEFFDIDEVANLPAVAEMAAAGMLVLPATSRSEERDDGGVA